jgi:hypothetical protein
MATPALKKYRATLNLIDHAGKTSRMTWNISSADFAAYLTDTTAGNVRTLIDAAFAETLDNKTGEEVAEIGYVVIAPPGVPADENAVNSAKIIVLGRDTVTGSPWKQEIPARNAAEFTSTKGAVDLTSVHFSTYVTEVNAHALSEDGNAVKISEAKVAGKGTQA